MQKKLRIGLITPARLGEKEVTSGSGFIDQATADGIRAHLQDHPAVAETLPARLDGAFVRNGKVYAGDLCLSDLDAVFWLYYVGDNDFSWDMLELLARQTLVLPDPAAARRARSKYHAHAVLRTAGLATSDFCVFAAADAERLAPQLAAWGDVLLKPILGDFGHGICKVSDARSLVDAVAYAQSFSPKPLQIFCERFEPNDISRWVSATVIDGQVIFGYRKRPDSFVDGWKVYDAGRIGGNADYVDISALPVAKAAIDAARALGCDIIGFDFIYSTRTQSYVIVDENTLPGLYADCFGAAGKGSLARLMADMVLRRLGAMAAKARAAAGL